MRASAADRTDRTRTVKSDRPSIRRLAEETWLLQIPMPSWQDIALLPWTNHPFRAIILLESYDGGSMDMQPLEKWRKPNDKPGKVSVHSE